MIIIRSQRYLGQPQIFRQGLTKSSFYDILKKKGYYSTPLQKGGDIISNMKNIRCSLKMTQKELAILSNTPLETIKKYEQGHKDINRAAAIKVHHLAKALHCPMEDILELEEEEAADEQ